MSEDDIEIASTEEGREVIFEVGIVEERKVDGTVGIFDVGIFVVGIFVVGVFVVGVFVVGIFVVGMFVVDVCYVAIRC